MLTAHSSELFTSPDELKGELSQFVCHLPADLRWTPVKCKRPCHGDDWQNHPYSLGELLQLPFKYTGLGLMTGPVSNAMVLDLDGPGHERTFQLHAQGESWTSIAEKCGTTTGNLRKWRQHPDAVVQFYIKEMVDEMFSGADKEMVYKGYIDDPRNTDNAWLETTAYHFHCPREVGDRLHLSAGDDARRATWIDVNPTSEPRYANLYASHREWVDRVAEMFAPHERARAPHGAGRGAGRRTRRTPRPRRA